MRRRALLAGLVVGLAGCSERDQPAVSTTNPPPTTGRTTTRDTRTATEHPATPTGGTEQPTETTAAEPTETVVVAPGDDVELPQGTITLGQFIGTRANFFVVGISGYVRGGDDRIYAVLEADLSDYDNENILTGSQFEVTVDGNPISLDYSQLHVDIGDHSDGRTARLGVPLPVGEVPGTAALWFVAPDRRYRYQLPDRVRSAMGDSPDISVATSFPEVISASDDSTEVEVEFLVRNDGDRPWTLTCIVDHDRIEDGGWPVQLTVPAGEQRRASRSVLVSLWEAQEVTFEASWGFGGTEKTVPVERKD
ncbi:hypothetical protein [Haloarchaeobius litoreus]|uniref:DUF4352 domain-containing protein n=1 Tax=Haloarchaeobius litoreus TaxID=755306 RepID=A0ABD6DGV5_9EURY|nr:hypothetical protein [Haloarchaeobius litoreus]